MSDALGTYSFLPWLRSGIAGRVTTPDHDTSVRSRASVRVDLAVTGGEPVAGGAPLQAVVGRDVELYGPGDIIGIEERAISRNAPRNWVTNHEPNHLAHVEFYDEDFPWRYTPSAPGGGGLQLRPWITLLVLEEEAEFEEAPGVGDRPLPAITVTQPGALPDAAELWAWAHVHVNRSLAADEAQFVASDMGAVLPRLAAVLAENPDLACSRLMCPRRLQPNKAYHAFVVPTFESGRLAGLGHDPTAPGDAVHATMSAWDSYTGKLDGATLPVYHRWYFRTGGEGDFESLVRLLKPREVDARVGTRDFDVLDPGPAIPPIDDADLGGVLRLGGALRAPRATLSADERAEADRYERWAEPAPHPFQTGLAALVNLADDYGAATAEAANAATGVEWVDDEPDPLVTAPLYARWHALRSRLLVDRDGDPLDPDDNWVHELNLDPRHRVAAGFGTEVIQRHQEDYMAAAWAQVGDVLEANRRIRAAQLAREVAVQLFAHHIVPLASAVPERVLELTAPVQRRVLMGGATLAHQRAATLLAPVVTSAPLRRMTRPGSRLVRGLPFDERRPPRALLARINAGEVSAAPPKVTPPGAATVADVADAVTPADPRPLPERVVDDLLGRLLALLAHLLRAIAAWLRGVAGRRLWLGLLRRVAAWLERLAALLAAAAASRLARGADAVREENLTPEAVEALPAHPLFTLLDPQHESRPQTGDRDSPEAARLKTALRDWHTLVRATEVAGEAPEPVPLVVADAVDAVLAAIDPDVAIVRRAQAGISLPERIADTLDDGLVEVMAHPVIDIPMYEPLKERAPERLVPNLDLIPADSITLLETNQPFIEAYMAGLNHEFARELLWREYPTDNRASAFRQFWDVRGRLEIADETDEERRERFRDIPPLHRWQRRSKLGDHDQRELAGDREDELVLVIRGELLKKYPTAEIYVHHAAWQPLGGPPDPTRERVLEPLTASEQAAPPRTKIRTPLYEAKVDPDIYFFGFDLTAEAAKGGPGTNPGDDAGWFFVISERSGEPRFGLDIERDSAIDGGISTFNDLAWPDAAPGGPLGDRLLAGNLAALTLTAPGPDESEKATQHGEDVKVVTAAPSGARWATVLYQAPVMVAVHAAEML